MSLNTDLSKTRTSFGGSDWDEAVRLAQQAVKDQASNKGKEPAEAISIHPLTPTPEVKELSPTKKSKIELAQRITSWKQKLHSDCNIYLSSLLILVDIFKSSYRKMVQPLATRFFFFKDISKELQNFMQTGYTSLANEISRIQMLYENFLSDVGFILEKTYKAAEKIAVNNLASSAEAFEASVSTALNQLDFLDTGPSKENHYSTEGVKRELNEAKKAVKVFEGQRNEFIKEAKKGIFPPLFTPGVPGTSFDLSQSDMEKGATVKDLYEDYQKALKDHVNSLQLYRKVIDKIFGSFNASLKTIQTLAQESQKS